MGFQNIEKETFLSGKDENVSFDSNSFVKLDLSDIDNQVLNSEQELILKEKRNSFETLTVVTPSKSIPTNKLTETSLTTSMSNSPIKFKDSVNMFQENIEDFKIEDAGKVKNGEEKKEDFTTILNNMFASITGTSANSTEILQTDPTTSNHNRNTSISSISSIQSAGKTFRDLFLKDLEPDFLEDSKKVQEIEVPSKYSIARDINFANKISEEKFHNTFKTVPADEQLLSEVFQVSLAKEKPKQKTGTFVSSALSVGSVLTEKSIQDDNSTELVNSTKSNTFDKSTAENDLFWFGNDFNSDKGAGTFNTNNNGELFISQKYIGFHSFKNLLNLWTTNILIYIHDIESINNAGTILINKHRANKDLRKMQKNIIDKSLGNENGITITTVYDQTYAFYNIPKSILAKRTLQTIWDVNVEEMSYLEDDEKTPPLFLQPEFGRVSGPPSRSISSTNIRTLENQKKGFYNQSPNVLKAPSGLSAKRSMSNLTPVNSNSNILSRVSRQASSSIDDDKFTKEESEIEDEIMSIDERVGISVSEYKKLHSSDKLPIGEDDEDTSFDDKSVNTMKLSNISLGQEHSVIDSSDDSEDSFDSDDEYYNGALKLSTEEYNKKITVFDFKETSNFNYTGPLYHEDTEFLTTPEIDSEEEILAELTVDCTPGQLFEIMFSEHFNNFLLEFLEKQDSSNFQPLKFGKFDKMNQEGQRYREYHYDKKLNYPIGPSATRCMVKETILVSNPDEFYKVINSTSTPDVPSGSAFNVKTCYQLRWTDDGKCFMKISFWIEWIKSSWIKGMIEKSCKSGQAEATKTFCDILLKYCEENIYQIEIAKGKAMRSLVFNHRLSMTSKKRAVSGTSAKNRQVSSSLDETALKKVKSPLFKPNSPRKSPLPSRGAKLEDVTDLDLNSNGAKVAVPLYEFSHMLKQIDKTEKLLILQNVLLAVVAVLLLMNLLKNYKRSSNWKNIYLDHIQKMISFSNESSTKLASSNDDINFLSDKDITEKLLNTIEQLISKRLEQQ